MPDFTIEVYYHCESAEDFTTEVDGKYTVRWNRMSHKNRDIGYDYSCTCPAYKFRPGYCKHIKQVIASGKHCNWNQFIEGGKIDPKDPKCPRCGKSAFPARYAV